MNTNTPPSPNEGLNETKKVPSQPTIKSQLRGIGIAILIGVVVILGSIFIGATSNTTSTAVPEVVAPQDNSSKHYSYVLEYIKAKATHPSTVDFCSVLNLQKKTEKQPDGSTLYAYRNCMTAKNSFGVELKYDWVVVLEESTNGSIKVINSDIKEE